MSGHSKWSTIKHKKALKDAKRGKMFTKLARAITVAAQEGGADPESNPTLRTAIDAARQFSMPKGNIQRAIERGTGGGEGAVLQELVLEGYGPEGVALVVTALTDNRNRTISEIRKIFDQHGGALGEQGSASYIFKDPENPLFEVQIEDRAKAEKVLGLVEVLDEHDDVQNVLANFDIPEEFLEINPKS
jgi:YebC/PmpR family DNA-binding regulatory protein